jgi:hypothetical protein
LSTDNSWQNGFETDVQHLARRICLETEVYSENKLTDPNGRVSLDAIKVLYALKYVNALVSPALRPRAPPQIADEYDGATILANGVGICGQQVEAMIALCDALSIPSRMVQMSWFKDKAPASHVAVETFVEGKWRYLDVSFASAACRNGNIYDILSLEEVIEGLETHTLLESTWDPWRFQWIQNFGDPIEGLPYAQRWDIAFDGSGTFFVPFENNIADFSGRNAFVGVHARNNNRVGNLALAFDVPVGMGLEIDFGPASFYAGKVGKLIARDCEKILLESEISKQFGVVQFLDVIGCVHVSVISLDVSTIVVNGARLVTTNKLIDSTTRPI